MTPGKPRGAKKKMFIVDDHPIVRERLAQLIDREPDLVTCGEAEDATQALHGIEQTKPDLVLLDLSLKDSHGLELIKALRKRQPKLPILVLSMYDENVYAERVLRAGARGYITKQEATQKVLTAIRKVLNGKIYLSERMASLLLEHYTDTDPEVKVSSVSLLSDRELEIYRRIGMGLSTRDIAQQLHLGLKTVESYRSRIKAKLGLTNSTQLLQRAIQWVQDQGIER